MLRLRGTHRAATVDPSNQRDAYSRNKAGWQAAERDEIENHLKNGSWEEIHRSKVPKGRRIVRFTWAYKVKRTGKLKARLCVQGCTQIAGADYNQSFCATMRSTSLRLLSSLAAQRGFHSRRWDFVSAYCRAA